MYTLYPHVATIATVLIIFFGFLFLVLIAEIAGIWQIFRKAGYEGWEALIPIYNAIIFFRIIGKPWWWLLLFFIPGINIIFIVWSFNMLSKSFGKDEGFTAGLVLMRFLFIPLLGFGSSEYNGPYGDPYMFKEYNDARARYEYRLNA